MSRNGTGSIRQRYGYCALTRQPGKLVKSHILPEALTKPDVSGSPLIQHGIARASSQRWSSWYDGQLVTAKGEQVLAVLDDWGIRELRRLKLVWSGWQSRDELELQEEFLYPSQWIASRRIRPSDPRLLRRFLHSLLWRAAATKRSEFDNVSLAAETLEKLRLAVLGEFDPPELFLPVYLVQLSTKGPMHNRTPFPDVLVEHGFDGDKPMPVQIRTLRFYFDGLVAHFVVDIPKAVPIDELKRTFVGSFESVQMATIPYEESAERLGLEQIVADYNARSKSLGKDRK